MENKKLATILEAGSRLHKKAETLQKKKQEKV